MALLGISQVSALNFWFDKYNQQLQEPDKTLFDQIQGGLDTIWASVIPTLAQHEIIWFYNHTWNSQNTLQQLYQCPSAPDPTKVTYMAYALNRGLLQYVIVIAPAANGAATGG